MKYPIVLEFTGFGSYHLRGMLVIFISEKTGKIVKESKNNADLGYTKGTSYTTWVSSVNEFYWKHTNIRVI